MNHMGTNIVQEILRMGDQQQYAIPATQIIFQPNNSFHIQVIRWLVEHQTVNKRNRNVRI
jgi:predicted transcriptional regulator